MSRALVTHLPHLAFVVIGVLAYAWAARSKPATAPAADGPRQVRTGAAAPVRVRPTVARRGLAALTPLIGATLTGAALYGVNLARSRPAGALIWLHVALSGAAIAFVAFKLAGLGARSLRRGLLAGRLREIFSLVLGVLLLPLLVTGVVLLVAPGSGSFAAYAHLVLSAWWTGLLLAHLWRYLRPSLVQLFARGR